MSHATGLSCRSVAFSVALSTVEPLEGGARSEMWRDGVCRVRELGSEGTGSVGVTRFSRVAY